MERAMAIDIEAVRAELEAQQLRLAERITLRDSFVPAQLKTAAGVDLAYWQEGGDERAVCCIVVIDMETRKVIEKQRADGVDFPLTDKLDMMLELFRNEK